MQPKHAIRLMLWLLVGIIGFHLCILLKIIPYEITWGGRLSNDREMYVFESISIIINLFLGLVLLIKGNYIRAIMPMKVINVILWIFLFLFALNTIGNILAKTYFEKFFSIITLAFVYLTWTVLKKA